MYPLTTLSPAMAIGLGHCLSLLAKRIVRELPMLSSSVVVNAALPLGQPVAAAEAVLLHAEICLQQDDVAAADRLVQKLLQRLSLSPNASFLRQPEPWQFLARLAFLRGDPHDARMFLKRSMSLASAFGSGRPGIPADKHGRALHCSQFLLQSVLYAHDGAVQAACQAFSCGESASQLSDGPETLRPILLTRCILELHQDRFIAAWKAYQAADLLRSTARQLARQAPSDDGAERVWLRQFAGLQQPAECN